jgi:phospholipid/cholesterol/gamma-HCH transport system substrate-binding protein
MRREVLESLIGGSVLVVGLLFLVFAYTTGAVGDRTSYELFARFGTVGSLVTGDDVRVSGIPVGQVADKRVDPKTFDVVLVLSLDGTVKLPVDTRALVTGESLAGGKYVQLVPGTAETMLAPGQEIEDTKDVVEVEALVGELIRLAVGAEDE